MSAVISSGEAREAMAERLDEIVEAIRITLEDTPPELSSDIYDKGIVLTGGGAYLRGLALLVQQRLKIRAVVAKNPYDSVCAGIGRIMESEKIMGDILKYRGK
jgi:rod shape-determining protein MreB